MESDGEDELVDEDEEFDEDVIAGGSVSPLSQGEGKLINRKSLHRQKDVRIRSMLGKQRMMRDVRISRISLVREVQLSRKRFVPLDMGRKWD